MSTYDQDDGDVPQHAYYRSNRRDPLMLPDQDLDDRDRAELEDLDDLIIRPTDLLLLAGHDEDGEWFHFDLMVHEPGDANTYVHHDHVLGNAPLALEWVGHRPAALGEADVDGPPSFAAVGTLDPGVELWNVDVHDALEPDLVLAGRRGHASSVLSLSWNRHASHLLASASADKTVKLWDLDRPDPLHTFAHHADKVGVVAWNRAQPTVLLTGSFDRTCRVLDARSPAAGRSFTFAADVEAACWDPLVARRFVVATEDGAVAVCDALSNNSHVVRPHADGAPCTGVAVAGRLLATCSTDGTVRFHVLADDAPPQPCGAVDVKAPLFDVSFNPDSPSHLVAVGLGGTVRVIDVSKLDEVQRALSR